MSVCVYVFVYTCLLLVSLTGLQSCWSTALIGLVKQIDYNIFFFCNLLLILSVTGAESLSYGDLNNGCQVVVGNCARRVFCFHPPNPVIRL